MSKTIDIINNTIHKSGSGLSNEESFNSASYVVQNDSSISLTNIISTKGFIVHEYTGTGASNSINLGTPLLDFTTLSNGTGYWHDRAEDRKIVTSGAFDWEYFTMENEHYLAVANYYNGSTYNIDSKIYKYDGSSFVEFQSIATSGAIDWEYFSIENEHYLAVTNYRNDSTNNINSKIYKYDGSSFVEFQSIATSGAFDWEYFSIENEHYLAVANYYNGSTYNIDSKIYKYDGSSFVEFQSIATSGAFDWEYFTMENEHYLAVANYYNGSTNNINSKIYKYDGSSFVEFQSIATSGAFDWEYFTMENEHYLAVANQYNNSTYNIDSKIYKYDGSSFIEFQSIATSGARDWEYFTMEGEHYLAVANQYNNSTHNIDSKIYKYDGSSFVEFQSIATSAAYDWQYFSIENEHYLVVANHTNDSTRNIDSKIYIADENGYFRLDCVRDDSGKVLSSGELALNTTTGFGASVHIKNLTSATDNTKYDSLRGAKKLIHTNSTSAEVENTTALLSFTNSGFTLGTDASSLVNESESSFISYITIYTHIKWGLTNQGKRYLKAYNPITGEELILYEGSGVAGNQIPTDGKAELLHIKGLDETINWLSGTQNVSGRLNLTNTLDTISEYSIEDESIGILDNTWNTSDNTYITYISKNTQHVKIGQYVGTGGTNEVYDDEGNLLFTLTGSSVQYNSSNNRYLYQAVTEDGKIVRLFLKCITSSSTQWKVFDYSRGEGFELEFNTIDSQSSFSGFNFFNPSTTDMTFNRVVDNDEATGQTQIQLTSSFLHYTDGKDVNGFQISKESVTQQIPLSTFALLDDGDYYVYKNKGLSTYGTATGISNGLYDKESVDDNRLVFDKDSGDIYTTTGGELVTNGTFDTDTSGWTAGNNATLTQENGSLKISYSSTAYPYAYQLIDTVIGETYKFKAILSEGSSNGAFKIFTSDDSIEYINAQILSSGVYEYEFMATTTSTKIWLEVSIPSNGDCYFDNISVYKKQATLDTALTTPISAIAKVQVNSGTPQQLLELDLPKNVIDDTEVEKLTTNKNRVSREIGAIYKGNRYTIPFENFFDDYSGNPKDYEVKLEVYRNNMWSEPGWFFLGTTGSYGAKAFSNLEGIVIQTGSVQVSATSINAGGGHGASGNISGLDAIVIVTYLGKTKER